MSSNLRHKIFFSGVQLELKMKLNSVIYRRVLRKENLNFAQYTGTIFFFFLVREEANIMIVKTN